MCMCMCICTCAAMCAWYRCVPALQQFNSLKEHIKLRWKEDELIYQLKTEIDIALFGDKVKQWIWKEHNQINKTIQECQTCRKKKAGISSLRHHMGWEDCDQLCLQLLICFTYRIEISTKLWNWICIIMNCSNNNKPKEDQHTHEMCSHNLKIIKTNRNQETIEQMLNMQWEEADHNVHEHTQKSFRSIRWSPLKVDRVTTLWLVTTPTGKHDSTFNWRRPVSGF